MEKWTNVADTLMTSFTSFKRSDKFTRQFLPEKVKSCAKIARKLYLSGCVLYANNQEMNFVKQVKLALFLLSGVYFEKNIL